MCFIFFFFFAVNFNNALDHRHANRDRNKERIFVHLCVMCVFFLVCFVFRSDIIYDLNGYV